MKKKIVVILLAVAALVMAGVVLSQYRIYPAYIKEINISVAESLPPKYYLRVVAGGPNTCWKPWRYCGNRFGNMIFVQVLTLHHRGELCGQLFTWEEKIIALGSCFIPGMKYTVVVNNVTETFVA